MDLAYIFLDPQNSNHRQYEALRAYFVEHLSGPEVALRFGYTPGSLHQLVYQFRQNPQRIFFVEPKGPSTVSTEAVRRRIIALRKQNQSSTILAQPWRRRIFRARRWQWLRSLNKRDS